MKALFGFRKEGRAVQTAVPPETNKTQFRVLSDMATVNNEKAKKPPYMRSTKKYDIEHMRRLVRAPDIPSVTSLKKMPNSNSFAVIVIL